MKIIFADSILKQLSRFKTLNELDVAGIVVDLFHDSNFRRDLRDGAKVPGPIKTTFYDMGDDLTISGEIDAARTSITLTGIKRGDRFQLSKYAT